MTGLNVKGVLSGAADTAGTSVPTTYGEESNVDALARELAHYEIKDTKKKRRFSLQAVQ